MTSVYVPSRTRPDRSYRVDIGVDGTAHCTCEAAAFGRKCWHLKYVKEEMHMTTSTSTAMTTAIVPVALRPPLALIPTDNELARMGKVAEIILAGGMDLPDGLDTPAKVMAVMLKGRALGLDPTIAIEHIHLIDGHSVPDGEIMAALLARDDPGSQLLIERLTETECTMRIVRPSRGIDAPYTVKVTDTDVALLVKRDTPHQAPARGGGTYMTKPGAWVSYPRDRLRWHCTKRLLKIYAPEIINGMGSLGLGLGDVEPEMVRLGNEYGGVTVDSETGEVVEAVAAPVVAPPSVEEAEPVAVPSGGGRGRTTAADTFATLSQRMYGETTGLKPAERSYVMAALRRQSKGDCEHEDAKMSPDGVMFCEHCGLEVDEEEASSPA